MAVETLTVQDSDRTGAEVNLQAVTTANGFRFPNDGKTVLVVTNDVGALVLNITVVPTVDSEAVDTKDITVTASETWTLGPWPVRWYTNSAGFCDVAVDADLALGVAPVRVN